MVSTTPVASRMPDDSHRLQTIDVDLHHQIADWSAIAPFAPAGMRHRFTRTSGPPLARHGFRHVGAMESNGGEPAPSAHDPNEVKERYLERRGVDVAILTGSLFTLGVQPNADLAAAVAGAVNDWTLATWVRPLDCFKGSILVAPQDPIRAAAEIDRLGNDPGMVQVLMGSASESPFGRRAYHPIYEACVRHDLPLALHIGGEGAGMSPPATAVGHPATTFEWYGALPQSYMAHLMSMVTEGVFERFPSLRVVLYEGGIFWLPHVMWRFDKNWKAQRSETPWVKEPPSAYIRRHVFSTTYPLEAAPNAAYLHQMIEMIDGKRTLLFSSGYPDSPYGDPFEMLADLPAAITRRVMVENALAVYGERLLAANR